MNGVPNLFPIAILLCASSILVAAPSKNSFADSDTDKPAHLSIGLPTTVGGGFNIHPAESRNQARDTEIIDYDFGRFSLRGAPSELVNGVTSRRRLNRGSVAVGSSSHSNDGLALSLSTQFDPGNLGSHRLTGGTNFLDLSALQTDARTENRVWSRSPDDRRLAPDDVSGFNLTLEGGNFPAAPSLSYRLTYIRETGDSHTPGVQTGFSAGIANKFDFGLGVSFTPSVEAARMMDADTSDHDLLTTSMLAEWRNWNLALTYSQLDAESAATPLIDDYQAQASIGYVFDFGMTADIGWERMKRAEDVADRIGFQFKYRLDFGR